MNIDISIFNSQELLTAASNFFLQLGIKLNSNTAKSLPIKTVLGEYFKNKTPFTDVRNVYFAGLIDDSVFQHNLLVEGYTFEQADSKVKQTNGNYNGLMLFALELSKHPTRTEISELTRAFNRVSQKMPVVLLLRYGNFISLALPERFLYKQEWREGEKIGKVIILRDINTDNPHAGHLRILQDLANHNATNYNALHEKWFEVLDVNILNKGFYKRLVEWYAKCFNDIKINLTAASKILEKDIENELKPQAVIRVIVRMMFIWFMKEKGLIKDIFFKKDFAKQYLKSKDVYYNAVLQNLFFAVLNKKIDERRFRKNNPKNKYDAQSNDYGLFDVFRYKEFFKDENIANEFVKLTKAVPFVNGGLFQCHDYKFSGKDETLNEKNTNKNYIIDGFSDNKNDTAKISDIIIFELIDLFNSYVWTIEESTPAEQDIALDPELLGTVFENLIGFYNPETKENARKQTGSFYTPREIVDYMCRESLKEALKTKFPALQSPIEELIDKNEDQLNFPERNRIIATITDLKILDPACGSGAFPMGMFLLMVRTIEKLQERKTTYKNKLDIITNCIYGVDIQNIAIEISKLRFFISLLVDYKTPERIENFEMLPNLETKFVVANTLIGIEKNVSSDLFGVNQAFEELTKIFLPFTTAKTPKEKEQIKNNFNKKKKEIVDNDHFEFGKDVKEKILKWDPFNICYTSPFFDSVIMFGIQDGFDIVIGNPPYVFTRDADFSQDFKDYIAKNYFSLLTSDTKKSKANQSGKINLFALFILKGLWLSKNKGVSSWIVPNNLLRTTTYDLVRKYLLENTKIVELVDLGSGIFENVTASTIIFRIKNEKNNDNNLCKIVTDIENLDTRQFTITTTEQNQFIKNVSYTFSLFANNKIGTLLDKISDNKKCLGGFTIDIIEGIVAHKHLISDNVIENSVPLVEGKTIKKYGLNTIKKHLLWDKDKIHRTRPDYLWNADKKIIIQRISGGSNPLTATLDISKYKTFASVNNILLRPEFVNYYEFILAIINSKVINWYYANKFSNNSTLTVNISKTYLEQLPIPTVSLALQQPIISLVDQILSAKKKDSFADTSSFEAEIDRLIYELYGLTEDEIKIVGGKK
jgi:type I restriction-modification system DNA methylase subunit